MFPDFSFSLPHVNEYKNISLYLHLVSAILFWCQCPQFKTRWRTPKLLKCNFILLFLHSGCMDQNNSRINKKNKCLFCADCSFVLIAVLCSLQFCAHCNFVLIAVLCIPGRRVTSTASPSICQHSVKAWWSVCPSSSPSLKWAANTMCGLSNLVPCLVVGVGWSCSVIFMYCLLVYHWCQGFRGILTIDLFLRTSLFLSSLCSTSFAEFCCNYNEPRILLILH